MAASISGVHGSTRPNAPLQAEKGEPGVQWPKSRAANSSPIILASRSDHKWRMAKGQGKQTAMSTSNAKRSCAQSREDNLRVPNEATQASAPVMKKRKPIGPLLKKERPSQKPARRRRMDDG